MTTATLEQQTAETKLTKPAFEIEDHKKDIDFFLTNAKLNASGTVATLSQADFEKWSETHGVARADHERMKALTDRFQVASAVVAATVMEKAVKAKIDAGEDASGVAGIFKTKDVGFTRSAKVTASQSRPAGMPEKPGDPVQRKTVYGEISYKMKSNTKIAQNVLDGAAATARKCLGL